MSKRILPLILLVATASTAISTNQVRAADLDPGYAEIPALQETKVEFGSGWYIRGDIGPTSIPKVQATSPALGYAPQLEFSGHALGYTASLGTGYAFTKWFRTDAVFDFHQPVKSSFDGSPFACQIGYNLVPGTPTTVTVNGVTFLTTTPSSSSPHNGQCTGHYGAALTSFDALVNGYIDLGTWHSVTPYVGAGIGIAFGHYSTSATYSQADGSSYNINITEPVSGSVYHINLDRFASGEYYNLAFALMAGVSIDVYDHTKLDIGYRYLHLGSVLGSNLNQQEVRAGLRYMIDN